MKVLRTRASRSDSPYSEAIAPAPLRAAAPITGTTEDDVLVGTRGSDVIYGLAGDDSISGKGGDDTLVGGRGADLLNGGRGVDTAVYSGTRLDVRIDLSQRQDGETIVYIDGVATDRLRNIESLTGGEGNDRLFLDDPFRPGVSGGPGALNGGSGDDILGGSRTVDGGDGDDIVYGIGSVFSPVVLAGGAGAHDLLSLENVTVAAEGLSSIDLRNGNYRLERTDARFATISGFEDVTGTAAADWIYGDEHANVVHGGGGSDTFFGGAANAKSDTFYGEAGNDSVIFGNGTAYGGDGLDTFNVEATLATSIVALHGGDGNDSIYFAGNDDVQADLAAGTLAIGNGAHGTVVGVENVTGGFGDDVLIGNTEANWIQGGRGADVLTGGAGADTFLPGPNGVGGAIDRISDFSASEGDTINLTSVDADAGTSRLDRFRFIGDAEFSGQVKELRYEVVDGNTFLLGDTDGDGDADYTVQLDGVHLITQADLILR